MIGMFWNIRGMGLTRNSPSSGQEYMLVISLHGPFLIVQHNPETTNNGTEDVEGRTEHHVAATPIVETQEKQNQVTTLVKHSNNHYRFGHQIEDNIVPIINFIMIQIAKNNGTSVAKKLFNETRGRGAGGAPAHKYISAQQLKARTRMSIRNKALRLQQEANDEGDLDGLL